MGFFLFVCYENKKQEIDLDENPSVVIGTSNKSNVIISEPVKNTRLRVKATNLGVKVKSNVPFELDGKLVKRGDISPANSCIVSRDPLIALIIGKKAKDSTNLVDLSKAGDVQIGRSKNNNIVLNSRKVSENHARIEKRETDYVVRDLDSTNGTYVNDRKISEYPLNDGDVISIVGYKLLYNSGFIFFKNVGYDLSLNIDEVKPPIADNPYPLFQRSPRLPMNLPASEVEIQAPPQISEKPQINLIPLMLPSFALMVPAVITGALGMLYFSVPMALSGVLVAFFNYNFQKKNHRKKLQARLDIYNKHLDDITAVLAQMAKRRRDILNAIHSDNRTCFDIVANRERRLWERTPSDRDFMYIKIGKGEQPSGISIKTPRKVISIENDALLSEPDKILKKFSRIDNAPIVVDAIKFPTIGIIGDRKIAEKIAQNIIIQVTAHHSYEDVKLAVLYNREDEGAWSWLRWLPHSWDDSRTTRYVADSRAGAVSLLRDFDETVKTREREIENIDRREKENKLPYILFVVTDRVFLQNEI